MSYYGSPVKSQPQQSNLYQQQAHTVPPGQNNQPQAQPSVAQPKMNQPQQSNFYQRQFNIVPPGKNNQPRPQPQPIVVQPKMAGRQAIATTPGLERPWNSGLCDCCKDCLPCMIIALFPCCYLCFMSERLGEECATPCVLGCTLHCGSCTSTIAAPFYAYKLRIKHKIHGSLMEDVCTWCWCWSCLICRIKRELDYIEFGTDERN